MSAAELNGRVDLVLFDLDGTLIDSGPDLAGTANDMRAARGLAPLPYARLRPMVGAGARGMIGVAFGVDPAAEAFGALRSEFLARYRERLLRETVVFPGVAPVLDTFDACGLRWGIVTNKQMGLAEPVVLGLGLAPRAAVLVGGDSTPHSKPHPAPLLEAARRVEVEPARCIYVGDDLRDVQAGRAAGMPSLAVRWGYLGEGVAVDDWGADAVLDEPSGLLQWLRVA
jgi:phosphoglycolate phosphatase